MKAVKLALLLPAIALAADVSVRTTIELECPDPLPEGVELCEEQVRVVDTRCPEGVDPDTISCRADRTFTLRAGETTPPPIEPPPNGGAHDHYDAQAADPHTVAAWSLRDDAQLAQWPHGVGYGDPAMFEYDPDVDGMRLEFSREQWEKTNHPTPESTGISLDTPRILQVWFDPIGPDSASALSLQIEFRMDTGYSRASAETIGWSCEAKLFTVLDAHGRKWLEPNTESCQSDNAAYFRERYYRHRSTIKHSDIRETAPIQYHRPSTPTSQVDFQMGGRTAALRGDRDFTMDMHEAMLAGDETKPVLVPHHEWCRFTMHVEYVSATEIRHKRYLACESFDPIFFFGSIDEPGEGLNMVDPQPGNNTAGAWRIPEHNASRPGSIGDSGVVLRSWYRNVIVMKDRLVPLGGRPIP